MPKYKHFRIGARVNGLSFDNIKILGEYRGSCNTFGVYVYGVAVGVSTEAQLHKVRKFTLELIEPKIKKSRLRFENGEKVRAKLPDGSLVIGTYMNCGPRKSAWIKGYSIRDSPLTSLPKPYKVARHTIKRDLG